MSDIKRALQLLIASCIFLGQFFYAAELFFPSSLVPVAYAADTGALVPGGNAAVTSSAGDNNGFEATVGTVPRDELTSNDGYIRTTNTGNATSTSCALPNTGSDQHDFHTFGITIPAGGVITGIKLDIEGTFDQAIGTNTICTFLSYDGGTSWTAGQNSAPIANIDVVSTFGSSTDLWGRSSWSSTEVNNTNFRVRVMTLVASNNRDYNLDYLTITAYYNNAPDAPTQDAPTDDATGVSTTPTFLMTATDDETDSLGYKVTIYSDSGCTSAVQTNDQASSGTGWSGTDDTCTGSPTSCYASGTQASYTAQSALSGGTQYWWRASAKDPDGSNAFTDSATCNSFTTESGISISMNTDGIIDFGVIPPNTAEDTSASGLNDIEEVQVDAGPADLDIRSTDFTEGANTWTLESGNGANQVLFEFSQDGSSWDTFVDADTLYTFDSSVSSSSTRNLLLRLTTPTSSSSFGEYDTTITIVASSP